MFVIDTFINDCLAARAETEPRRALKEVLDRAMNRPGEIAAALPATRAEVTPLYSSDELTVLKAVWAPHMSFRPHNHLMWAAIGVYGGQEDNTFYRRDDDSIVKSGGKRLREGASILLGADTIHAVTNPVARFTGAIHIYGGDITNRPGRSEWDEDTLDETDYDFDRVRQYFEAANARQ